MVKGFRVVVWRSLFVPEHWRYGMGVSWMKEQIIEHALIYAEGLKGEIVCCFVVSSNTQNPIAVDGPELVFGRAEDYAFT